MSLSVIRGNGLTDFQGAILDDIQSKKFDPIDDRVFYIIPNHIKFNTEVNVLTQAQKRDLNHPVEVYSLTRLVWNFLDGEMSKTIISDTGLTMMIQKVLNENSSDTDLASLSKLSNRTGFVNQMVSQIKELRTSQVQPEDLLSVELVGTSILPTKIKAIAKLLSLVNQEIEDKNVLLANESLYLLQNFFDTHDLSNYHFYFQGFSGFTQPEQKLIETLVAKTDVTVAIIGDTNPDDDRYLFYKPNHFVSSFDDAKIQEATLQRQTNETIKTLEKVWYDLQNKSFYDGEGNADDLTVAKAASRETEIEFVTNQIQKLVMEHGLRYRDILVLARDLNDYQTMLDPLFARANIPVYIDLDTKLNIHPFAESILTLLNGRVQKMLNEDIFKILKTGLFVPAEMDTDVFIERLDLIENFFISNPTNWKEEIKPSLIVGDFDDDDAQAAEVELNKQKLADIEIIRQYVLKLVEDFKNITATTNQETITQLVNFLKSQGVITKLIESENSGRKVWNEFSKTIDEVVSLYGQESFNQKQLLDLLRQTFLAATFAGAPNTLDTVQISEAGATQSVDYRAVFIIGATSKALPATASNKSMFNDNDREELFEGLAEKDKYLQDTSRQQMVNENFVFYQMLLASNEKIFISYPEADYEGGQLSISNYVSRILEVVKKDVVEYANHPETVEDLVNRSVNVNTSISHALYQRRNGKDIDALAKELFPNDGQVFVPYSNAVEEIGSDLAHKLFGDKIKASVSAMETYYKNPYDFYLTYGLKLKERSRSTVNAAIVGSYFHAGLQNVYLQLRDENKNLSAYSDDNKFNELIEKNVRLELMTDENPTLKVLELNTKNQIIESQLKKSVVNFLRELRFVSQNLTAGSKTIEVEQKFGTFVNSMPDEEELPALSIGDNVELRGKIDRVDIVDDQQVIFDYKTSGKDFDFNGKSKKTQKLIDNGLEMQLLSYADALGRTPNAAFYLPIRQKKFKDVTGLTAKAFLSGDDVEKKTFETKARGFVIQKDLASQFKNSSPMFGTTKETDPEVVNEYIGRVEKLIQRAANNILSGKFTISPYMNGEDNGMKYSKYKSITRHDVTLGDTYNYI